MRPGRHDIRAGGSSIVSSLYELWQYKAFVIHFNTRFLRMMFGQTFIGPAWLVVGPLTQAIIITIVFSKIVKIPSDGVPYILFLITGQALWGFTSGFTAIIARKLRTSRKLMSVINYPRLLNAFQVALFPIATFFGSMICLLIALVFYLIREDHLYLQLRPELLLFPFILILCILLAVSFGMIFGAMNCITRDIRWLMPHLITLATWLSPIYYPISVVAESAGANIAKAMLILNPMAIMLEGARWSLFGQGPFLDYIAIFVIHSILIIAFFLFCLKFFERAMQFIIDLPI